MRYKESGFSLKPFPGYSDDQWGIKAHNRPWLALEGRFKPGERVIEVGGAYSLLAEHLAEEHGTESWIADDFGCHSGEEDLWQRWGDPAAWIASHPKVRYVRKPVGIFDQALPSSYFDCVFSISTLEHIHPSMWPNVWRDMLRISKVGGRLLHAIDIPLYPLRKSLQWLLLSLPGGGFVRQHPLRNWRDSLNAASIQTSDVWPGMAHMFDRSLLVESTDVVFRFYPPNNQAKPFPQGGFSLLIELLRTS